MFKCEKVLIGSENIPAVMHIQGTASETFKEGEALVLSGGVLTKATTKVDYIALNNQVGGIVPVFAVNPYTVYSTALTAVLDGAVSGDKLALSTDGMAVAGESATGVATIHKIDGEAVGSYVEVIFK